MILQTSRSFPDLPVLQPRAPTCSAVQQQSCGSACGEEQSVRWMSLGEAQQCWTQRGCRNPRLTSVATASPCPGQLIPWVGRMGAGVFYCQPLVAGHLDTPKHCDLRLLKFNSLDPKVPIFSVSLLRNDASISPRPILRPSHWREGWASTGLS